MASGMRTSGFERLLLKLATPRASNKEREDDAVAAVAAVAQHVREFRFQASFWTWDWGGTGMVGIYLVTLRSGMEDDLWEEEGEV